MTKKKATKPARESGSLPEPDRDGEDSQDFNQFLKATDIGKLGAEAVLKFTGECRLADSEYGEQLVCEVKHGNTLYDFPIKLSSPSYRILFERFGKNPAKWKGQVKVVIKNFMRKDYVAVSRVK